MNGSSRPLDGKTIVVTGGGRGIGKMIAEGLLTAGASVYLTSRKLPDLDATVQELAPLGRVFAFAADLGTSEGVESFAAHLGEREERVHALFNNAGATWGAPLEEFPPSAWDRVLDVNVKGVFLLTQTLLPLLRAASTPDDPARVVNIGSIDGLLAPAPGFNNFSYAASKAAVHMLTRQLATTLAPEVLVNAIAPGFFPTKMTAHLLDHGADAVASHIPLQRLGRPGDMAGIAVFLAGPDSTYITGAVIPVDGGLIASR